MITNHYPIAEMHQLQMITNDYKLLQMITNHYPIAEMHQLQIITNDYK